VVLAGGEAGGPRGVGRAIYITYKGHTLSKLRERGGGPGKVSNTKQRGGEDAYLPHIKNKPSLTSTFKAKEKQKKKKTEENRQVRKTRLLCDTVAWDQKGKVFINFNERGGFG